MDSREGCCWQKEQPGQRLYGRACLVLEELSTAGTQQVGEGGETAGQKKGVRPSRTI